MLNSLRLLSLDFFKNREYNIRMQNNRITQEEFPLRKPGLALTILAFVALYITSFYNYVLFHTLAEIFSIIVFAGIFMIAWNSRHFLDNHYFLFLGITLSAVGFIDLLHTLSYKGIGILANHTSNIPTQLWIAARYLTAFAFLLAPIYVKKKLNPDKVLGIFLGLSGAILLSIFYFKIFPVAYIEGVGLTPFKKVSEYIISIILLVSVGILIKNRHNFNKLVMKLLVASILVTVASEMLFTLYVGVYGSFNLWGHILKVISALLIYQAIIVTSLKKPYSVLFRNLKKTADALQDSEAKFRSIFESSSDAIVLANSEGAIMYWNEGADKIFGYKEREALGKPLSMIMPERYREGHLAGMERIKNGEAPRLSGNVELHGLRKNGEEFPLELSVSNWKVNDELFFGSIMRDITARKKNEAELALMASFPQLNPLPVLETDIEGQIHFINPSAEEAFPDLLKKGLNHPWLANWQSVVRSLQDNNAKNVEREISVGEKHYWQTIQYFKDRQRIRIYASDITVRKKIEKQLRNAKKIAETRTIEAEEDRRVLEAIINYIPEGIVVADMPDGKITLINKYGQEMIGKPVSEIIGTSLEKYPEKWKIFNPASKRIAKAETLPLNKSAISGEIIIGAEWLLKGKDGKIIPILCNAGPVKDKDGNITGAVMSWRDITKRKNNELKIRLHSEELERLANDMEKFKLAVENASDLIVITDGDGKIIYANNAASEITGFPLKEIIGERSVPWGGNMPKEFYQKMWQAIKTDKRPFFGEVINSRKNGEKYVAQLNISPVLDEEQDILFFVGIGRDITKAKEIDRAKSEFISMASHQLRTPLASASLSIEMLLGGIAGKFSKEQKDYLNQIYGDIWGMAGLIDAFLNVSRIELGIFILDIKPTDITKVSDSAVSKVLAQIKQKEIKLKKIYKLNLPLINLDFNLMRTAIENLLTNAIKYTPKKGRITVEIAAKKSDIIVTVSDTGCGIPKNQQKRVFSKLFRGTNVVKMKTEGMGLGLYVVKSVIEKMGGKVSFKSIENKGTSFHISMPVKGVKNES